MTQNNTAKKPNLARFALISVAAAIVTIALKSTAYALTGSVGLLSDALESVVNLVGALMAFAMLSIAARPADENHTYGHTKAEYFSSGVEGALILVAAVSIAYTGIERLIHPKPIEQLGLGLIVSVVASLINLSVSLVLKKAGKRYNSISLTSDASHLMTDVWTSGGVLVGVGLVGLTRWQPLDSIVAILVAVNIIYTGVKIIQQSVRGLMDVSLPREDLDTIEEILERKRKPEVQFHNLMTRQSGSTKFIALHVLVPGGWTVSQGHKLVSSIENELAERIASVKVFTHLESKDDPASMDEYFPDPKKKQNLDAKKRKVKK
jgi:cation diffusion facilitator family transporter